jgi:hypothetical protein
MYPNLKVGMMLDSFCDRDGDLYDKKLLLFKILAEDGVVSMKFNREMAFVYITKHGLETAKTLELFDEL